TSSSFAGSAGNTDRRLLSSRFNPLPTASSRAISGRRTRKAGMDAELKPPPTGETGDPERRRPRRLSEVFSELAARSDGPVSVGAIRDALGDRSFAALLVFFAFPNILPLPPGATTFLGLPLVLVSAQMIYGRGDAWLPEVIT